MHPQIGQHATKTSSQTHLIFASFFDLIFDQKWLPKWTPKLYQSPFWGVHFSHVVPDLALGSTFVNFWFTFGPPRLHFGFIRVPFFAPKGSFWGPFGFRNLGASISGTPQRSENIAGSSKNKRGRRNGGATRIISRQMFRAATA